MGLPGPCSSGSNTQPPNPDPKRFTVLEMWEVGSAAVAVIRYDGCTTYEGRKVLVFESYAALAQLLRLGKLDPHFLPGSDSPVARFEPTARGKQLAMECARQLSGA